MNAKFTYYAEVPWPFQRENIAWVVLEHDREDTGGYFLYLHTNLDDEAIFDEWYETRELAENAAEDGWGIQKGKWREWVSRK